MSKRREPPNLLCRLQPTTFKQVAEANIMISRAGRYVLLATILLGGSTLAQGRESELLFEWPNDDDISAGPVELAVFLPARDLAALLKDNGERCVAIGNITAPKHHRAGAAPQIARAIEKRLEKLGVTVAPGARFEISGSYRPIQGSGAVPDICFELGVNDREGKHIKDLSFTISDPDSVSRLMGLTFRAAPYQRSAESVLSRTGSELRSFLLDDDPVGRRRFFENQHAAIGSSLVKPSLDIRRGTEVFADAASTYGLEILVRGADGAFQPRTAMQDGGMAFVEIKTGEDYEVRLVNNSRYEASARLFIDGLDMFEFSKEPGDSVILKPSTSTTIPGWHLTDEISKRFLVTPYDDSAASLLRRRADLGLVTALFSASWEHAQQRPGDEPPTGLENMVSMMGNVGTGFGATVPIHYATVKRHTGVTRSAVTIRYSK
jgi:hypothetical protein